jgi:hypothetical protein
LIAIFNYTGNIRNGAGLHVGQPLVSTAHTNNVDCAIILVYATNQGFYEFGTNIERYQEFIFLLATAGSRHSRGFAGALLGLVNGSSTDSFQFTKHIQYFTIPTPKTAGYLGVTMALTTLR